MTSGTPARAMFSFNTAERLIATFFGYVDFAEVDPEEPAEPLWRQRDFAPPLPPDWPR